MRFAFNDEQQMFQDLLRRQLARDAPLDRIRQWGDAADLAPFNLLAAREGWAGIGAAEHLGGQGGGMVERAILFEELGRAGAPVGGLLSGMLAQSCGMVDDGVVAGTVQVAFVHDAQRPPDCANVLQVARHCISGSVPLVLNAPQADRLVAPIVAGDAVELWGVDAEAASLSEVRLVDCTSRLADVKLDGSATPVGECSMVELQHAAACAATLVAADSLGLARRMLDMTTGYVKEREQFGVAVGSFQAVKHAAAQMLVDIEAAHSGVYYAAWALENDRADGAMSAWIAKAFGTEAAAKVADMALFLHGAVGYTWEYDLHVLFKRAKINVDLFGSARTYRSRIAEDLHLVRDAA